MQDSTQVVQIVNPVVQQLMGYLNSSVEFVKEQAPEVIRQYLQWAFWSDLITIILCVIVIGAVSLLIRSIIVKSNRNEDVDEGLCVIAVFGGIGSLFCTVTAIINIYDIIQITVAPKVYLLEHLAKFLK